VPNDPTKNETSGTPASTARAGIVAVVGRANVGKSSLVNAILGEKISIVSPVAQTTRHRIRGILNDPRGQVVLLDTPGVLKAESDLGEWMNKAARQSAEGTDGILLVLDASMAPREEDEGWIKRIVAGGGEAPVIAVLNKSDLGGPYEDRFREIWAATEQQKGRSRPVVWLRASAATGKGLGEVVSAVFAALPVGPALFPDDILTDFPRKLFIGDIIREKLFLRLEKELPHRVASHVTSVTDTPDGGWEIAAEIWVERGSQKGIVIGHKGRMLRAIRRACEAELKAIYERPVRVILQVIVQEKWTRNFWMMKQLGLDL
jgi:GTP-binding protein Era